MKYMTAVAVAAAALIGGAFAVPFDRRDVVWVTETEVTTTTVEVIQTIYADGPGVPATISAQAEPTPATNPTPAKPPRIGPTQNPATALTTSLSQPTSSIQPISSVKSTHTQPSAPKSPKTKPSPTTSSTPPSSSGGSSGGVHTGDGTYYAVGLGSCGWTSVSSQAVVALSWELMNNPANPNDNPLCGRMISITYKGVTETAKVVDTCAGCAGYGDVDMSTSLFQKLSPLSVGRLYGVEWHYI